jgi:HK97 family phage major capsid protein
MAKVDRAGMGGQGSLLLPDEVSEVLLRGAAEQSLIAQYGRSRPMNAQRVKITEAQLSDANVFWVNEGARKSTDGPTISSATWTMNAEELAVIVPLDENVQDDATVDLFELFAPSIETAIARKVDRAAIFGDGAPAGWTDAIVPDAATVGHAIEDPRSLANDAADHVALLEALAGDGVAEGVLSSIENDGYDPSNALVQVRFRSVLRNLKDADNRYVFGGPNGASVPTDLFGVDIDYVNRAVWAHDDASDAKVIMGDFGQAILGTRQGIRFKTFDQGVISDGAGNIVYSLMEQDMIALRVTARYGFKVIADDTADSGTLALGSEYPFATLVDATPAA